MQKFYNRFSSEGNDVKVSEINGTEDGVAFFLNFSVHASNKDHKKGEDTRILPVHYSDNYFSLVPGEEMAVTISFEVPMGVTPRVSLHGWNYDSIACEGESGRRGGNGGGEEEDGGEKEEVQLNDSTVMEPVIPNRMNRKG
ncbi:mannosylglycoprotein endo-beta-mannosidase [Tanacetum coccineum]